LVDSRVRTSLLRLREILSDVDHGTLSQPDCGKFPPSRARFLNKVTVRGATTVAVTGLAREARIIARSGFITVVGGGDRGALELQIRAAIATGARRVLSIGICGALSPELGIGDCIAATEVVAGDQRLAADASWVSELLAHVPGVQPGVLLGSDSVIADPEEKERLHRTIGAVAVDMESHIAAGLASRNGVPFAALRFVSDLQGRSLPPAALIAMLPSGKVNVPAVILSVVSRPAQIRALIRTAWDAEKAFRALSRSCRFLSPPGSRWS
jgi:hopanoid-associated phosphorylase